jgi:hypothetical protein
MLNKVEPFKKLSFGKKIRLSIIALIVGIMVLAPLVAAAENPNPGVVPVNSGFFGKTYKELSVEWWKWVFSIPKSSNPLYDDGTGEFTTEAQSGNVWFLAGSWNGTTKLNCTVPAGKAIFLPIINNECSRVEGQGKTEKELRACTKAIIDNVTVKEATIDGRRLKNLNDYRVASRLFVFRLPVDNVLGLPAGPSPSVSDGYWILLTPLSEGEHNIYIHGELLYDGSTFKSEMNYKISVKPKRR